MHVQRELSPFFVSALSALTSPVSYGHMKTHADKLTEATMAVYGYCRVSTAKQAAEGESLDVQRRQIEGYDLLVCLQIEQVEDDRELLLLGRTS
jgi:hypothetical protein